MQLSTSTPTYGQELVFAPKQLRSLICSQVGFVSRKTFYRWRKSCGWVYDEYPEILVGALVVFAQHRLNGLSIRRCAQLAIKHVENQHNDQ